MPMRIIVEQIPNRPIDSNSFVIYEQGKNSCIVIDPGTEDCAELIEFFEKRSITPAYILLTHEHFDHIWGVNKLKEKFDCKLICSSVCSERIVARKKNMSVFYDQVGFETAPADIVTEDIQNQLEWNEHKIIFIPAKGHTKSSICILIDKNLFTGDTIIRNTKTVIKLPGGSKSELLESLSALRLRFYNKHVMIQPGHGESFLFDEIKDQEFV